MKAKCVRFVLMAIGAAVLFGTSTACWAAQDDGKDHVGKDREHTQRSLRDSGKKRVRRQIQEPVKGDSGRGRRIRGRSEEHGEFLKWLAKNYPEESKKLAEIKNSKKPELFKRQLALKRSRYGRIFEASKRNPELAKVLKQDLQLQRRRNRLLRQIISTKDEAKKKELTNRLREVVSSRFDVVVQKKQIEYEQLLKKLEALKEQVKKSKAAVNKWTNAKFKKKNVNTRVKKLVSRPEEFNWD